MTSGAVLDASCGIGTQAIGLAHAGFAVTATDISPASVRGNLRALRYLMKALGEEWAFIMTDVTKGPAGHGRPFRL